jgi:uncharacterized protein (TIGR03067 family)
MRPLSFVLLFAVLSLGFAPAPFPRPERRPPVEVESLVGEWKGPNQLIVTSERMDFNTNGYRVTFDRRVRPAAFDLKGVEGTGGAGRNFAGIYRLEGDTLTICYNAGDGPRPMAFEGPGKGMFTEVYTRVRR